MTAQEKLQIAAEIADLNVEYWYDVDRRNGAGAHGFYTEDGVFTTSLKSRTGQAAIQAFYQGRQAGEKARTARHVITNQRVLVQDTDNATSDWILLLHAADGAPVLPSVPAIMIADVHDVCRRGADGCWRYRSRTISAVFKSDTPTTG
ncbi:MAG: nuclear transport factor 2 family protein [Pseudomonadota bacterium]